MSIWDDPELKVNDDYVSFTDEGDTVTGVIVSIRAHRFDDGKVVPQILLDLGDGVEKTVTAGQVQLKARLAELRPEAGDRITITLTKIEKRAGGKTLKHFDVQVGGAGIVNVTAPAAAGGKFTPEQIEAMKLLGIDPTAA